MPSPANITVTASSNADSQATGSAAVALKDDIVVQISPTSATVSTGAGQALNATVTGTGAPSTAVTWSVNGNADGLNTICFIQSSAAFTAGVLAFTRVITANAPGASVGASGPAALVGQILDADILFRNEGQATYATPGALVTTRGQGAYDLGSLLTHELGHHLGLDHSAVWRSHVSVLAASRTIPR